MPRRAIVPLLSIVMCFSLAAAAEANWLNGVGRYLGVGWSDGYHSQSNCPPKHAGGNCPNCNPSTPWWATPAQSEMLPHPARAPIGPHMPTGPSLFRQSGDGSSVIVTEN